MTRRDYVKLAAALAGNRPQLRLVISQTHAPSAHAAKAQWVTDRDAIADVLAADNPRFDRERFNTATEK